MPELHFQIEGAEVLEYAAAPTLLFRLAIASTGDEPIRSILLNTQVRILPDRRGYAAPEQRRLVELFGDAARWGDTLRSTLWTHTVVQVPAFIGVTSVGLPVPCTYDFEVASAKYFHALDDGEVPLEFLFSGSIFYRNSDGVLQIAQIPWEHEARFRLPVRLWRRMMEHYFPNSAWLRLRRDTFDRLYAFKAARSLASWEDALEALLRDTAAPASAERR